MSATEDEEEEKMPLNKDTDRHDERLDSGQFLGIYDDLSYISEEDESGVYDDELDEELLGKDVEALYNNLSTYELQLDKERFIEMEKMLADCDDVIRESDSHLGSLESFKKTISLTFSDSENDDAEYLEFLEICGPETSKGDNSQTNDEEKEQLFLTEGPTDKAADETILDENNKIIPAISNKISDLTRLLQIQLAEADETYTRLLGQQHKNHQQMNENTEKLDSERRDILAQLEEEKAQCQHDKEVKEAAMCKWEEDFQIEVEEELETQQIEIQKLEELMLKEREVARILTQIQEEERAKREMKAATRIQSTFRMYRTMKEYKIVQEKRREEEEAKAKLEEERKRSEEEKEKEKERRREEEERERKEEAKRKREEERRKVEEERKEEERKKCKEKERKRQEEERREREEKERKKREEEEEKEKEKEEQERKKKEEEERRKKEEDEEIEKRKREAEERVKREEGEERRRRGEEERMKKEEEARKKREEEEARKKREDEEREEEEKKRREGEEREKEEEREKREKRERKQCEEESREKTDEEKARVNRREEGGVKTKEDVKIMREEETEKRRECKKGTGEEEEKDEKVDKQERMREAEESKMSESERMQKSRKEVEKRKEEDMKKTKEEEEEWEEWEEKGEGGVKIKEDVKIKREGEKGKEKECEKEKEEKQGRMKEAEESKMSGRESMQKSEKAVEKRKEEDVKTTEEGEGNNESCLDGKMEVLSIETKQFAKGKMGIDDNNGGMSEKQRETTRDKKEGLSNKERERASEEEKDQIGVKEKTQHEFEKHGERRQELKIGMEKDLSQNMDGKDKNETIEFKNGGPKKDQVSVFPAPSEDQTNIHDVTKTFQDTNLQPLPQILDVRRLAWMENCLPWGKISNAPWIGANKNQSFTKLERKRPPSNKRLPKPLSEETILSASKCTSLTQVTSVHLKNLNGFTLATLGQCPHLQYLSVNNCQLLTLDSLQACSKVRYIDVKNNNVEYVNVKGMESLQVLDLSHNNLALIHGFDDCSNLLWLNMQYNRITKLGSSLGSLWRLQTLLLGHNQLISTSGLQAGGVEIQTLDLSHNQLHQVTDVEKFCLLRSLDVSCNNLLEAPKLTNHVLIQDLNLSENCLSSLTELSQCWLPLLKVLNVGQNRLSSVPEMPFVHSLKIIDVSNNQLLDFAEISNAFSNCKQLERLLLHGNPFSAEHEIRDHMVQAFPRLHYLGWGSEPSNTCALEEKRSASSPRISTANGFQRMCSNQVEVFEKLEQDFRQRLKTASESEPPDLLGVCDAQVKWCQKSLRVAVEYRYAHEYGDTSTSKLPSFDESDGQGLELTLTNAETPKILAQVTSPAPNRDPSCDMAGKSQDTHPKGQVSEAHLDRSGHDHPVVVAPGSATLREHATTAAAAVSAKHSQALQYPRLTPQAEPPSEDNSESKKNWKQTESIKNPNFQDPCPSEEFLVEKNRAATLIQAVWRGFRLRVKLQVALEFVQNVYKGEEEEEDGSEFEEEINLDTFIMAEAELEKSWTVSDTPTLPTSFPVLRKPPLFRDSSQVNFHLPVSQDEHRSNPDKNPGPAAHPRQAWNTPMVSARSSLFPSAAQRPKSSEVLRLSPPTTTSATGDRDSDILPALISKRKDDEICKEWGFKDARTAQMMIQRAKKMKLNAERREKLKKLDPHQRLALFRKLGEVSPLMPVKSPSRKMLPRKEYFQARHLNTGLNMGYFEMTNKEEENKVKESRTYQWIHAQIDPVEKSNQRSQQSFSEKSVSQSSKKALNARQRIVLFQRHHLTSAGGTVVTGTSDKCRSVMDNENETIADSRRHSTPGSVKRPVHLPPIDRSPASTSHWVGSISHWNPDVKKSGGWGGGKKRVKRKSSPNVSGAQ